MIEGVRNRVARSRFGITNDVDHVERLAGSRAGRPKLIVFETVYPWMETWRRRPHCDPGCGAMGRQMTVADEVHAVGDVTARVGAGCGGARTARHWTWIDVRKARSAKAFGCPWAIHCGEAAP